MPIIIAIYTFIVSAFGVLGGWLVAAFTALAGWFSAVWVAALAWLTTVAAMRVTLFTLIVLGFISLHITFTTALVAVLPDVSTVTQAGQVTGGAFGDSLLSEFWAWFAFLKPPHLETYISSIASTYIATYIYRNAKHILMMKQWGLSG